MIGYPRYWESKAVFSNAGEVTGRRVGTATEKQKELGDDQMHIFRDRVLYKYQVLKYLSECFR